VDGIQHGDFLEHAEVHGNLYGTSFQAIRSVIQAGKVCILDIDTQVEWSASRSFHGLLEPSIGPAVTAHGWVLVCRTQSFIVPERLRQHYSSRLGTDLFTRFCSAQGVRNIKSAVESGQAADFSPIFVFIAPPSFEALEARLRGRKTESEEDLRR
jgi:guanylate kinase